MDLPGLPHLLLVPSHRGLTAPGAPGRHTEIEQCYLVIEVQTNVDAMEDEDGVLCVYGCSKRTHVNEMSHKQY